MYSIPIQSSPQPFNSQKWFTCNFSLQYPYIVQQKFNENTWTYQVEVVILMSQQILVTNLQGNVKQLEGRIDNQIFGQLKGWSTQWFSSIQ